MAETITKAELLADLSAGWEEWKSALAGLDEQRMSEPVGGGEWSVKDITAHLTAYNGWYVRSAEAGFKGELPAPDGTETMSLEERNQHYHAKTKDRSLAEVMEEADKTFHRLLELVAAHDEKFFTTPQKLKGLDRPVKVWEQLRSNVYEHQRKHARAVLEWAAQEKG